MTILIGYPTNRRARAVLELAGMLARSRGTDIVVCTAIRDPRVPGTRRDDPKFTTYADELADTALAQARKDIPADVSAKFVRVDARSVATGLIQAAEQYTADLIVVGSAMGRIEEAAVSSVADRLLHSSPLPVAVATRGFRAMGGNVRRVTLAFATGEDTAVHVAAAEELAARYGAQLRLASFAVNLSHAEAFRVNIKGPSGPEMWERIIRSEVALAVHADGATARRDPELVIGHGRDWAEALDDIDWAPGDLLVVGSSVSGPLARVFLGSRATKIIRNTSVPVIALPRAAATELADE
jgi:nucleotide-binding universal stress UspA family protein